MAGKNFHRQIFYAKNKALFAFCFFCLSMLFFMDLASADDFKVSVSLKDNDFFLYPAKEISSKLIVSNMGNIDAQIFVTADIDEDFPFELIVESNPSYVYANDAAYDKYLLINEKSYGVKEIKFSLIAPYKKIKKEQKKIYTVKINVFASPVLMFADKRTIKTNIKHQYQYEIKIELSDDFVYLREDKMSFSIEDEEPKNYEENEQYEEAAKKGDNTLQNENSASDLTGKDQLYFGKQKNTTIIDMVVEKQTFFHYSTIIVLIIGFLGIYTVLKL
ncbi:MAG: hypothetical protein KAQ92_05725 [Candidatus Aenigmarchaeota archaeon]|nr:hypothetical protein [Candidatus Aenigmarchaeota archaeon]